MESKKDDLIKSKEDFKKDLEFNADLRDTENKWGLREYLNKTEEEKKQNSILSQSLEAASPEHFGSSPEGGQQRKTKGVTTAQVANSRLM